MKIDRLLGITIYLLNHGKTSAGKLAQQFEVSVRTIIRDMDTLSLAGIPVVSAYGAEGGYEIMNTFVMNGQTVSGTEYGYIVSALEGLISAYGDKKIETTLEKMQALRKAQENTMLLDLSAAHENRDTNEMLYLLNHALQIRHQISFQYTNSSDESRQVEAEPAGIIYKWYNWYLIAYYPRHQEYCMFKVVRMDELKILEKENEKVHQIGEIQKKLKEQEEAGNTIQVVLYCKAKLKSRCREYLNGSITREFENGDFEYTMMVPEGEQFWYGVLLSFGMDAKVLAPKELIRRMVKQCSEVIENYQPFVF